MSQSAPTLREVFAQGIEDAEDGSHVFANGDHAAKAVAILSLELTFDTRFEHREWRLYTRGNKLIACCPYEAGDSPPGAKFVRPKKPRNVWSTCLGTITIDIPLDELDLFVRRCVRDRTAEAWSIRQKGGRWIHHFNSGDVSDLLAAKGYNMQDVTALVCVSPNMMTWGSIPNVHRRERKAATG